MGSRGGAAEKHGGGRAGFNDSQPGEGLVATRRWRGQSWQLLQERRVGGRVGFGRLSYCILWSLDLFKLLCTQHLSTVLTRAAEVFVALNVSSASAKQGPWCDRFVFRHMEEKHCVHYRVGRARGQLHGGASSPSL